MAAWGCEFYLLVMKVTLTYLLCSLVRDFFNLVIGVSNTSRHSVKSLVGMGSREQVVFVDDLISLRTSVSDRRRNSKTRGHRMQGGNR